MAVGLLGSGRCLPNRGLPGRLCQGCARRRWHVCDPTTDTRGMGERLSVVIVGAGLSGIGAAYRLQTECPERSYTILEARDRIGGTWDLFRYPGIRSDSDMFTLGYSFRPWRQSRAIAGGS